VAARALYGFLWSELADWYVEWVKEPLRDARAGASSRAALAYVLDRTMRLLHPVMPHLTEEVWQRLPHEGESIMLADWPEAREEWVDAAAEADFGLLMDVVRTIRSIKADFGLPPTAGRAILVAHGEAGALVTGHRSTIRSLSRLADLDVGGAAPEHAAAGVIGPV